MEQSKVVLLDKLESNQEQNFINKIICGDAIEVMKKMPENFVQHKNHNGLVL